MFSALLAAICSMINTSQLRAAHPAAGESWEMNAIASVVLGGTSMSGGIGTIGGTIVGALVINVLNDAGGINIAETGYAAFGITTEQDLLLHDGEYVRYLEDEGANIHYENDGGTIDLYAVRDESGALTGFREATQEEYDANTKQYMVW